MRVQRYNYSRRRSNASGCLILGTATLIVLLICGAVGLVILAPALPAILLNAAGFEAEGSTDSLFTNSSAPPAIPQGSAPAQVVVDVGQFGSQNIDTTSVDVRVGQDMATATFTESALLTMCRQVTPACNNADSRFRNITIDLRPGGAIVYADVTLPGIGITQRAGIVLHLNGARQFAVAGVDVNGTLFSTPPGELSDIVAEVERVGNDVLRQAGLRADGARYSVSEIYVDDIQLTIVWR